MMHAPGSGGCWSNTCWCCPLVAGSSVVFAELLMAHGALLASRLLHQLLLARNFRSPMVFFEVTPVGRIINRYSKDLDAVDTAIPKQMGWFFKILADVLGTLFIICLSTPIFLAVSVPLGLAYYFVQVPLTNFPAVPPPNHFVCSPLRKHSTHVHVNRMGLSYQLCGKFDFNRTVQTAGSSGFEIQIRAFEQCLLCFLLTHSMGSLIICCSFVPHYVIFHVHVVWFLSLSSILHEYVLLFCYCNLLVHSSILFFH